MHNGNTTSLLKIYRLNASNGFDEIDAHDTLRHQTRYDTHNKGAMRLCGTDLCWCIPKTSLLIYIKRFTYELDIFYEQSNVRTSRRHTCSVFFVVFCVDTAQWTWTGWECTANLFNFNWAGNYGLFTLLTTLFVSINTYSLAIILSA